MPIWNSTIHYLQQTNGQTSTGKELGIRNHYSSPRHPQANGQTEVKNQTLLKLIKTRLEGAKGAWPDELPRVLWAYRTTVRTPIGETPFKMAFGTEAVIPVEVGVSSLKRASYDEQSNDDGLKLALDCLLEVKDDAAQRMALYQERIRRYYNHRVKLKRFNPRDMILRKVSQATKDPKRREARPQLGRPIQGHSLFRERKLLFRRHKWETFASSMECKAP